MLKVVSINLGNSGSTGKIVNGISSTSDDKTISFYNCYPYERTNVNKKENDIFICNEIERRINRKLSTIFGVDGLFGKLYTLKFLRKIKKINPDVIHLHNLHFGYLNIPALIKYIKKYNIKVVWTLHDCWPFTGRCPHFTLLDCDKWKTGCHHCPYPKSAYPFAKIDRTKKMWELKKKWFSGMKDLTIVAPSRWLADLIKQSYLKDYPVKVINNGIDLSIFKPTTNNFLEKYNIPINKYIVLGVAFGWGERKGLDAFIELSKQLGDRYQIVLVGTNGEVDKQLPPNIVSIHRTSNQQELAEIYTAADVFFNPTREENYPTVNMEAIACGTPVITYNTGGSPEILTEGTGLVIKSNTIKESLAAIKKCCEKHLFKEECCLKQAKNFNMNERFKEYIRLYKDIQK